MRLKPVLVSEWPRLAWLAEIGAPSNDVWVFHGKCVEVRDDWCAEAVWCGDFADGDFDRTDRVFGTGVRIRGDEVVFVTSGTAMDRLWYGQNSGVLRVSNSMPALCARAGVSLCENLQYAKFVSTEWGTHKCTRAVPVQSGEINVAWFNNLVFDGLELKEQIKPDTAPVFHCYEDYFKFLVDCMRGLRANTNSSERLHRVEPLATISNGYDSPAVAALSNYAGCVRSVTIRDSCSLWRGSDSGAAISERLGMSCRSYNGRSRVYPNEIAMWAGSGRSALLSWTLFDYHEAVTAMFLGCYGDAIWTRKPMPGQYTERILLDLSMGEWRLEAGMLQCVVPFLGMRHAEEINAITFSDEMAPWTMNSSYDRPIPRRILEEAGIPRGTFGIRKKDTSHEHPFRWPYSPEAQESLRQYLRLRGYAAPPDWLAVGMRHFCKASSFAYKNTFKHAGIPYWWQPFRHFKARDLIFQWANEELKQKYAEGLRNARIEGCTTCQALHP